MTKRIFVSLLISLLLILLSSSALAADSLISGSIDDSNACIQGVPTAFVPAHIVQFTVTSDGAYTFSFGSKTIANNVWYYLYVGSFDPNQSWDQASWVATGNSGGLSINTNLIAGISYYMVTNNDQQIGTMADCNGRASTVSGSYTINVSGSGVVDFGGTTASTASASGNPCPHFFDGRINNCDDAAWIVIYPHTFDNGDGLIIRNTEGVELLYVMPDQLATVVECPATNTLIASGGGVEVYRIAGSCEYVVVGPAADGKKYYVLFDAPYAGVGYTSFEE